MNETSKLLARYFLSGDIHSSYDLLLQHQNDGMSSYFIYQYLIRDAMHYIGQMWEENEITVAQEHLATAICDFALSRYCFDKMGETSSANRKKGLFFCLEGEEHYIGIKIISSLFREANWDVQFLGANLPLEYAVYNAQKWKPDVIGISLSLSIQLPKLKEYVTTLENLAHTPTIIVGSRLLKKYDFTPYCTAKTQLFYELTDVERFLDKDEKMMSTYP